MQQAADEISEGDEDDDEESKEGDQSQVQLNNNQHENRIEMLLSEMRSDGGSVDLNPPGVGQQAAASNVRPPVP